VHGRPHGHLDGFQIRAAGLAAVAEDQAQELFYFACDFLLDGFRRFFSWGEVDASGAGRSAQMVSFTATRSRLRLWNR
jgi:hypothetical protein